MRVICIPIETNKASNRISLKLQIFSDSFSAERYPDRRIPNTRAPISPVSPKYLNTYAPRKSAIINVARRSNSSSSSIRFRINLINGINIGIARR